MKPVVACVIAFVVTAAASTGAKVAMTVPVRGACRRLHEVRLVKVEDSTQTDGDRQLR